MKGKVKRISAIGTGGSVLGKLFTAKPDRQGRFVLNRKVKSTSSDESTNKAVNKVYAKTLDDAADLLATDDFLINLRSDESDRALRELKAVKIDRY